MSQASIKQKRVLITGASSGIGRASAERLARAGYELVLVARRKAQLEEVAQACLEAGAGGSHILVADLADSQACLALVEEACNIVGNLDALVNAAGIARSEALPKASLENFEATIALNLQAPYLLMSCFAQALQPASQAAIINIASVAGLRGYPYVAAYTASKHGLVGLTRSAAKELAPKGIRVNAICPGYVESPMTEATLEQIQAHTGKSLEQAREELIKHSPQKRLFTPQEVAELVFFLLQPEAAGINGQAISVCGGEIA